MTDLDGKRFPMRYRRRSLLSCASALALSVPVAAALDVDAAMAGPRPPAADGAVVFTDGFDSGGFGSWDATTVDGNGTQSVVADPTDPARSVARFTLPNDGVSFRSELGKHQFSWGRYVYDVSILLPADWATFARGSILAQWHGYKLPDGTSTYPPIALNAYNTEWRLDTARLISPTKAEKKQYTLSALAPSYGRWTRWVFDITWSTPDSDGLLVISQDGTEVLRLTGPNNYHQQWSPHFQTGIYRSEWRPGNSWPTGGPDVVLYHRDITVTEFGTAAG